MNVFTLSVPDLPPHTSCKRVSASEKPPPVGTVLTIDGSLSAASRLEDASSLATASDAASVPVAGADHDHAAKFQCPLRKLCPLPPTCALSPRYSACAATSHSVDIMMAMQCACTHAGTVVEQQAAPCLVRLDKIRSPQIMKALELLTN